LKKVLLLTGVLLFLFLCAGVGTYIELQMYADTPAGPSRIEKLNVTVRQGQSLKATAEMLAQRRIIQNPFKLAIIARLKGHDKHLKAGEYLLSAAMTPNQILEIMVNGEVRLHKMTIPEGYRIVQIAEVVEKAGFGAKDAFIRAATDGALAQKMGIQADTLEGYLFPDTYHFPREVTLQKIISTMVQRFRTIFTPEWKDRAASFGFSVHEVVILASIIEKETGAPFERPLISSVFHNRLRKKMRLESDPTVIYGIKDFDGNLTRTHLKTRTPYNTYKIRGLPAGPIANPGRASLEAALFPEKTNYIYFVSKKDSTHYFSTNLKEHNRAVHKYQLGRN
jgi:UPF0755 protein